jgi:hypothetical protein
VKVRDRVVLVNNVTALNKLASEIGRDAIKVINDINTKSSEHNRPRSSKGLTRVKEHPQVFRFILQVLSTFQYALFHVRIFETDNNLAWW